MTLLFILFEVGNGCFIGYTRKICVATSFKLLFCLPANQIFVSKELGNHSLSMVTDARFRNIFAKFLLF